MKEYPEESIILSVLDFIIRAGTPIGYASLTRFANFLSEECIRVFCSAKKSSRFLDVI